MYNRFDRTAACDGQTDGLTDGRMGALKMQDQKMQDLKMEDQVAGVENAGPPVNTANR